MKVQLYLVQHGAAKSEAEDPTRGLTAEGRRDVEREAEFLAVVVAPSEIDCIEHSDKLRARQTAEILAARLRPARGVQQVPGLAPNDEVEPMCIRLRQESENVMLVGHLPHLSRLVSRLLGCNPTVVRFQMGGVVRLDRDDAGEWTVRWVLPPEVLSGR
jgi:phosphohistidine phosphatase